MNPKKAETPEDLQRQTELNNIEKLRMSIEIYLSILDAEANIYNPTLKEAAYKNLQEKARFLHKE